MLKNFTSFVGRSTGAKFLLKQIEGTPLENLLTPPLEKALS